MGPGLRRDDELGRLIWNSASVLAAIAVEALMPVSTQQSLASARRHATLQYGI
jgi:hypothetical protein